MLKVTWETDVWDNIDPVGAVKDCLKDIKSGETLYFTVEDTDTGKRYGIDLSNLPGEEIVEMSIPNK